MRKLLEEYYDKMDKLPLDIIEDIKKLTVHAVVRRRSELLDIMC